MSYNKYIYFFNMEELFTVVSKHKMVLKLPTTLKQQQKNTLYSNIDTKMLFSYFYC